MTRLLLVLATVGCVSTSASVPTCEEDALACDGDVVCDGEDVPGVVYPVCGRDRVYCRINDGVVDQEAYDHTPICVPQSDS